MSVQKDLEATKAAIAAVTQGRNVTELNGDEKDQIRPFIEKAEELNAALGDEKSLMDRIHGLGDMPRDKEASDNHGADYFENATTKSLGQWVTDSKEYRELASRRFKGKFDVVLPEWLPVQKAFGDPGTITTESDSVGVPQPQLIPGILGLQQAPLVFVDALPQTNVSIGSVKYYQESGIDAAVPYDTTETVNGAAIVAEGAAKPTSYFEFDPITVELDTWAHITPVSNQMLQDVPAMQGFLDGRSTYMLALKWEAGALDVAEDALTGVSEYDLGDNSETTRIAALRFAKAKVRKNGRAVADSIVVSPTLAAELEIERLSSITNNPSGIGVSMPIWGMQVFESDNMENDTDALVFSSKLFAEVFYNGGLNVTLSNSATVGGVSAFENNLTYVRYERRAALAVIRPSAGCLVDLTSP